MDGIGSSKDISKMVPYNFSTPGTIGNSGLRRDFLEIMMSTRVVLFLKYRSYVSLKALALGPVPVLNWL